MHEEAQRNIERFFKSHCAEGLRNLNILDVGACDVNGSMKSIFWGCRSYTGIDLEEGPNVNLACGSYDTPFKSGHFDVIVSSSVFEHDPMFWLTFLEMVRVCRPGGLIFIQVPSRGFYHPHPVDCWRFQKDSWVGLRRWGELNGRFVEIVESGVGEGGNGPLPEPDCWNNTEVWNDCWVVYRVRSGP
jgi:SAM-dependent methyltransferase